MRFDLLQVQGELAGRIGAVRVELRKTGRARRNGGAALHHHGIDPHRLGVRHGEDARADDAHVAQEYVDHLG